MSRKHPERRGLLLRLTAFLLAAVVGYQGWYAVQIARLRTHNPHSTAFMLQQFDTLRLTRPEAVLSHRWVGYEQIASPLKRAVVAAEDAKFTTHFGFDWEGIRRALEKNLEEGELVAGGSTITQQLAKNLYLSSERSFLRKGQEALLTLMLEGLLPKRRILEIYLNVIEWGEGVFGVEAAARHYFGVGAGQLSAEQAAWLAAMVPRPRHYDRHGPTAALERRAAIIRQRMSQATIP